MNNQAMSPISQQTKLTGTLINLRPVERRDLEMLVKWRNDPDISKCFFSARTPTLSGQEAWYENLLADERKILFIIETKDATPVGTIGLDRIDFEHHAAELGNIMIGERNCWGKRFGTDAAHTLIKFAFTELKMNRLYVQTFAWNERAIKLNKKCGFTTEGILRQSRYRDNKFQDTVIMSLLREEFLRHGGCARSART